MTAYIVTAIEKNPAAGERPGIFRVEAPTKSKAIAKVRKMAGWRSYYDSPMIYTACREGE